MSERVKNCLENNRILYKCEVLLLLIELSSHECVSAVPSSGPSPWALLSFSPTRARPCRLDFPSDDEEGDDCDVGRGA